MVLQNDLLTEERAIVDHQITELLNQLALLRSKRNRLLPISRLPVELLTHIFRLLQSGETDSQYYKWIYITQISSGWRKQIFETPGLWGKIIQLGPNRVDEVARDSFARAGAVPLDVYICIESAT
ncbi:hypothetical protein BDN72DRAFT_844698 [Pluteus cervinus]|uniref:Uncharacterized protein n=1 Tax=Pluteus cervinus TaxID=181527 RepID=A0ACD3AK57_9AGAR|nr:hypothetical protein BDN72DRAFT_844698 [Pluteus cervinus]